MSSNVFANGMEVACTQSDGMVVATFPNVCFTPPEAPPTPPGIPLPYPNTAKASDCADGSKTVTIRGKEVMLKNKSFFKKSTGDEAGSAQKKGVVTSTHEGKAYFNSWSMDVKVEGENVVRHFDMMTQNHASMPGNTPAWPFLASMASGIPGDTNKCAAEDEKKKTACAGTQSKKERCQSESCREAMKCELQPYRRGRGCCKNQTPHHILEVHCFTEGGKRKAKKRLQGFELYNDNLAPCVCCDVSSRHYGDHGSMHAIQGKIETACMDPTGPMSQMGGKEGQWKYKTAKDAGLLAHKKTFEGASCSSECLEAQLDAYHHQLGVEDDTLLRAYRSGLTDEQEQLGEEVLKTIESMDVLSSF